MRDFSQKTRHILLIAAVAIVALLLYAPSITHALVFDDLLHIQLSRNMDLWTVWLPTRKFAFYRPLVFLPFVLIRQIWGYYPNELLHGLNILQHSINVALFAGLVWRLWRNPWRTVAAGLLLASYPFAYQAVAIYGNNVYLSNSGLILLALHTYLTAVRLQHVSAASSPPHRWWYATIFLFLIGFFNHETIVIFGLLAAFLQWVDDPDFPWQFWSWPWKRPWHLLKTAPFLGFTLLGLLFILLYPLIPRGPGIVEAGGSIWSKLLYLVQSGVYPPVWLAHRLPHISANVMIGTSLVLAVMLSIIAALKRENRRPLLFGWGWWFLSALLLGITLPADYLAHSARLLYLGGVGIAIVWAILLELAFSWGLAGRLLWFVGLGAIVLTSMSFVQGRLAAFDDIGTPLKVIATEIAERPADEGLVLINLPAWTTLTRNTYAVGVEYVTLLGNHIFAEDLFRANLQKDYPIQTVRIDPLLRDPGYPYGLYVRDSLPLPVTWNAAGSHIFITYFTPEGIHTEYSGLLRPFSSPTPALATIGPYLLQDATATYCQGVVETALTWRVTANDMAPTISTFAQLVNADGQLIAQIDQPPLGIQADLLTMDPGWELVGFRAIPTTAAPQRLLVGVYDYTNGERFPVIDAAQRTLPDQAYSILIDNCALEKE